MTSNVVDEDEDVDDDLMSDDALKGRNKAQHEHNLTSTAMQALGQLDDMDEWNINWTVTNPGLTKALVEATFEDVAEEIEQQPPSAASSIHGRPKRGIPET